MPGIEATPPIQIPSQPELVRAYRPVEQVPDSWLEKMGGVISELASSEDVSFVENARVNIIGSTEMRRLASTSEKLGALSAKRLIRSAYRNAPASFGEAITVPVSLHLFDYPHEDPETGDLSYRLMFKLRSSSITDERKALKDTVQSAIEEQMEWSKFRSRIKLMTSPRPIPPKIVKTLRTLLPEEVNLLPGVVERVPIEAIKDVDASRTEPVRT